ncbi:MAG TPA: hypothetical protein VN738_11275 [Acidothermaceae bacterium]|nr:hypothetical protein [Acidothermaceae bacterium]
MAVLAVDVQVLDASTQTLILDFTTANGYRIVSVAEGDRLWRRDTASSKWVAGRVLTNAVLDYQTAVVSMYCKAASQSALRTLVANARAAMENTSYLLAVSIGGVVEKWLCEPADSTLGAPGGIYNRDTFVALQQLLTFTCPRSPILVA